MPPRRAATIDVQAQQTRDQSEIPSETHTEAPQTLDNIPENQTTDHEETATQQEEPTSSLTQAIILMTDELRRRDTPTRKPKSKEPDTFDGSDPRKLNNFILLCNLYFRNNPSYDKDDSKVTFALSYLRGTALEFFEPTIMDSDETPAWLEDWSVFVRTLRTQFGPIDPTADAENGIDNLRMSDNQRIVKYNVEFNRYAVQTGWDDSVLRHRYYSGLAERIKDIMGQQGKPATLDGMKSLAHTIDARHWERLREKSRANKGKPDNSKSDNKSDNKNKSSTSGNNNNSNNKKTHNHNHNKSNDNNKSAKQSTSSGNSSTLSDKLGKDGKLTSQERQRRFDNHLCMFCGCTGHTAGNCPKSSSSASKAKARAAQTKEKEKESTDSKKE